MSASTLLFDHAILAVRDLAAAGPDFESLGFTVFHGGEHAGGLTHNALITFADGSYLELLAPTDPALLESAEKRKEGYLFMFEAGEGFGGYAFHTSELDEEIAAMKRRGLAVGKPVSGSRIRTDGERIEWRMARLGDSAAPFFLTDLTPRTLRVPDDPERTAHANGVVGTAAIVVAVRDLEEASQRYEAVLGRRPGPGASVDGARTADFSIKDFTITLAAADGAGSPLKPYLDTRGEAIYALHLQTAHASRKGALDLDRTHGARLELTPP